MQTPKKQFLKDLWSLIIPYWKSQEKWLSLLLLIIIIMLSLGQVFIQVLVNKWNNSFYNTLQALDKKAFLSEIIYFTYLAAAYIVITVYSIYLNQMLTIRWRRWLTNHYLTLWLSNQNYYRMQIIDQRMDNPDQRISEDIYQFIGQSLNLFLGLLNSIVTLFSFLAILWILSGPLSFQIGSTHVYIPGYMVWLALSYALIGTLVTAKIGRSLIPLNFNQQRFEADFRYSMVRLRENSESVAFFKGESHEKDRFISRFTHVFDNFWQIMKRQKILTWFTSGYNQFALIFPSVIVAPRFFSGEIKLGGLMQITLAFGQVQNALSYIINSYTDIAAWKATTDRLITFTKNIEHSEIRANQDFKKIYAPIKSIDVKELTIKLPDGRKLLENVNFDLHPKDSLLITGRSGCGKTTLLRTLAGIWPFAEGSVSLPENARLMFLPQKPYFPLGNLKQVLLYLQTQSISEDTLLEILELCQLQHLSPRLNDGENWARELSLGEQQRINFVRAIFAQPDFMFLDESTSAVDEAMERRLYELLKERCHHTGIISVGHRNTLKEWHRRIWDFG